ncbi:MAG: hypothetical protein ACRD2O_12550 [Terriglobia bacterium]
MYKTVLVKDLIEEGRQLVGKLHGSGFPVTAALWYFIPERSNWKLIIASPSIGKLGAHEAYRLIQMVLTTLKPSNLSATPAGNELNLSLDDIFLMDPKSTQFRDLRRTIEGVFHNAAPGQMPDFQGAEFEDAHIYYWPRQ